MRYSQIRYIDVSNGEGIGISLFTQGCDIHCPNCHNESIWDFNGGKEFTNKEVNKIIELLQPNYITRFSILGGEPLSPCNYFMLACLIEKIKQVYGDSKKIWLWTGYAYEQKMKENSLYISNILNNIDVLVDGPYIESKKDITLPWRGSSNQRCIDVKKSLDKGEVILYCD